MDSQPRKLRHPPPIIQKDKNMVLNKLHHYYTTIIITNTGTKKIKTKNTRILHVKHQPSGVLSISYLEGGGTLGERDRALFISADREQWLDDITCSGTDNVELWKSLPFGR